MKKKLFIIISTLAVLVIGLFCLTSCGRGKTEVTPDSFFSNWQSNLLDSAKVLDVVMPGTHDSGTKGAISLAENQTISIYDQLCLGVRYFDLRVKMSGKKPVIFHSIATGLNFDVVLADFKRFTDENPSEVIVLDFQHFEKSAEETVGAMLKETLNIENTAILSTTDIATLTMGDMRTSGKKFIVTWGSQTVPESNVFLKRGDYLLSPYDGDAHKVKPDEMIKKFPDYYELNKQDKLFVLQCQLTPNGLQTPWSLEKDFCDTANNYIKSLAEKPELLSKTNIIMRDFIDYKSETVKIILSLNLNKNLVKTDCITSYTAAVKL